MKTKFFVLLIAVLSFVTAGFVAATNPPPTPPPTKPTVPIKDIVKPNNPAGNGPEEGINRAFGLSDFVTGQIDLDSGQLFLNFINEVDDIVVYIYHSELGLIATVEVDYTTNPTALIPIPDITGKYTIKIFGTGYEGEGEYDN